MDAGEGAPGRGADEAGRAEGRGARAARPSGGERGEAAAAAAAAEEEEEEEEEGEGEGSAAVQAASRGAFGARHSTADGINRLSR